MNEIANGAVKINTPLVEFIVQRRLDRERFREEKKEERRRKDIEKKKQRDIERMKKKDGNRKEKVDERREKTVGKGLGREEDKTPLKVIRHICLVNWKSCMIILETFRY